ncbi:50S ribosomal protein L29 [uncultured archaeon]|nr:50S ribosomal protein L29 [uncultured archaeon]
MAKVKFQDLKKMTNEERNKKMQELKLELVKSKASAAKKGSANPKQIKKMIAKIYTAEKQNTNLNKEVQEKNKK